MKYEIAVNINFNIFNSLIISGIIQGVIFAFVVLYKKNTNQKSNFFLAQVVLYLSLNNFYYWFIDTNISTKIPLYQDLYIPWNLLILPTYYCFVITYLNIKDKYTFPFFIPFIISLCIHTFLLIHKLFFISNFNIPLELINIFYYGEEYVSALFTFFVIYKTFSFISKYEKNKKEYSLKVVKKETKWLKQLLFFGVFISIVWIGLTFYSQYLTVNQLDINNRYVLWLSISFLVYWLGYNGIYYNGIFNQRKILREFTTNKITSAQKNIEKEKIDSIKNTIQNEKLYLNPNFGLANLSLKTGLNESYISHIFNKNSSVNFTSYINKLRINEAKKLLKKKDYKNYTIISIGLEAGFNSKSTFYTSFKKQTGLTPAQYRKEKLS